MHKINYFLLGLFLLISSNLLAQNLTVSGKVTAKETEMPVLGASVYLGGTSIGTATNVNGIYNLSKLSPGKYQLVVSFSGYRRLVRNIEIKSGDKCFDFELEKVNNQLEEVVVTGTGTRYQVKSAPVQTELFSPKLVKEVSGRNLEEVLEKVSPSFDFSPNLMGSRMQLNGLSNDYILILVDGQRLYGDIGGQSDLNRINPGKIKQIEVVKGASSSLYGSEAIAGVINIITKQSQNKLSVENDTRIGEYGEWQQYNSIDINKGKFKSSTNFTRKQSNGWQLSSLELNRKWAKDPSLSKFLPTEAKAVNEFHDYEIKQRISYNPTCNLSFYLTGSLYEKDVVFPMSVKRYGYYYKNHSYALGAKYLLKNRNYITLDVSSDNYNYYYHYKGKYNVRFTTKEGEKQVTFYPGDKYKNTDQLRQSFHLKGVFHLNENNTLSVGAEHANEILESEYRLNDESVNAYSVSLYAQDELRIFENLSLVGGLRFIHHMTFGDIVTPKLSALYKLSQFNFRATYANGFKVPSLKELFYEYEKESMGSHRLYLGNRNLKPQKSNYYSLSAEYQIEDLTLSFTAFDNQIKDLIDYRIVETSEEAAERGVKQTKVHYNIANARSRGIDFLCSLYIGKGFTMGGGYSYVNAENETENVRLNGTAEHYGNLRFSWDGSWDRYGLNVSLFGRIQSERFYEDGQADAYNLWKLTTSHHFANVGKIKFEATVGVNNLFDYVDEKPYGSYYSTLSPGRTFFCGVNIRFAE
ncbi:MAG: TonB-dependent receptor domain-containing protein [Marinifilaceae bacterium]